jgi:hypothetical protein
VLFHLSGRMRMQAVGPAAAATHHACSDQIMTRKPGALGNALALLICVAAMLTLSNAAPLRGPIASSVAHAQTESGAPQRGGHRRRHSSQGGHHARDHHSALCRRHERGRAAHHCRRPFGPAGAAVAAVLAARPVPDGSKHPVRPGARHVQSQIQPLAAQLACIMLCT